MRHAGFDRNESVGESGLPEMLAIFGGQPNMPEGQISGERLKTLGLHPPTRAILQGQKNERESTLYFFQLFSSSLFFANAGVKCGICAWR